jgi:hypothetical protein
MTLQRRPRQLVILLRDCHFGLLHPLGRIGFVLPALLVEQLLIGNRDCHLGLHLQQLVLHVDDDLLDYFFRILGLVDQVIEIRPNQYRYPF